MTTIERIKEVLTEELSYRDLVEVWNEYCNTTCHGDDCIYSMDYLDEELDGYTATQIIDIVSGNGFHTTDNFFKKTIYGIESFDDPSEKIDLADLAAYIVNNDDSLYQD